MALTQIRGEQIRDGVIKNQHVHDTAAIAYSKLNLSSSIVSSDLSSDASVQRTTLESKLIGLWNYVGALEIGSVSSATVTSQIAASAATDTPNAAGNAKGVLLTGTGSNGAGTENYRVQIRWGDSVFTAGSEPDTGLTGDEYSSGDIINDGLGGSVYGELRNDGTDYSLNFFKSNGTAFTFAATAEVSRAISVGPSGLAGTYFTINTGADAPFYVWFTVDAAGSDPAPGGTGIQVDVVGSDLAVDVATKTAAAITANANFGATSDGQVITITNAAAGAATDITAGTSGFDVSVITQGTAAGGYIDFMFMEIHDYYSAPLKGFVTGMGFADVAMTSGTHQHDDRYYTSNELEGGVLDDRYFTENELTSGQLDGRYYTQSDLNATGTTSGASLVGVDAGSITGLDATNLQSALAELQGDINGIVDGGLDITQSLDDAYNDGSAIAVDDTDVVWTLSDDKKFAVSSDGAQIISIDALAAGDKVTIVGDLYQSGGVVSIDSNGSLLLKDVNLTTAIPLSEDEETGLVGYTATSIVGALNEALTQANTSSNIGAAEDADYTDGLFVDFTADTPTGTAVDRFNEVLKSLAPKPAPVLADIGIDNGGITGKLSFGTSNVIAGYTNHPTLDVGGTYTKSGDTMGIYDNVGTMSGYLADNVAEGGTSGRPYPARAFGGADAGSLVLKVNGTTVHTVDLSSFASGSSVNANGSGFTLSAAISVKFDNGDSFDVFKYRTGSYVVNVADCSLGYNTLTVEHGTNVTNTVNFVIDDATTATSYSSEALSSLSMTGSKQISGVSYHTGGTAQYAITADNVYRNTYNSGASAVNYSATNASITDEAIPTPTDEADSLVLSGKTATVSSASRLLNGSISANVNVARTLQTTSTSTGASITGLLLDNTTDSSSATSEPLNGEKYRVASNLNIETTAGYDASGTSPSEWDSSQSLTSGSAGHDTGLLVYNDALVYPTQGLNGGDFSAITNGPASNVDYSAASGNRTYLRYFHTATPKQNFRLNVTATNTSFVSAATGASDNNLTMEVLAPNTTSDGSTVEWKDAVTSFSDEDGIGCYASTYGATIPTSWGCTLGTKNTSTSGNVIVIRITASAAWTGNISAISLTWL